MRAFKVVKNPDAFELMAGETRRRIIHLLRAKERTVSQIADELQKSPAAMYHQVHKLMEAELIEIAREERVDHFVETYYRASAEVFYLTYGEEGEKKHGEKRAREALQALGKLGLSPSVDEENVSRLAHLQQKIESMSYDADLESQIDGLEGVDYFTKSCMLSFAKYIVMTDKQFEELLKLTRELRELLRSSKTT